MLHPRSSHPRLLESEQLSANFPAGVQLGVDVDVSRPAPDPRQDGVPHGCRVLDQEPAKVRVSGGAWWYVKIHPNRAVEARDIVVNVGQERTVDVRKLDSIAEHVTVDGNRREPLRGSRDRGRLVRAAHERDEPFRRWWYRRQPHVILAAPNGDNYCQRPYAKHQTAAHSKPPHVGQPYTQGGLGIPALRGLFKRSFVIELSGRRQPHLAPQKPVDQPVEPAVRDPQRNPVEPPVRTDDHAHWRPPGG